MTVCVVRWPKLHLTPAAAKACLASATIAHQSPDFVVTNSIHWGMNDPWPRPTQGPAKTIETNYLVIGAGRCQEWHSRIPSSPRSVRVMIDRACLGGHWTTAYPFVQLHQPSAYYGVNSRALGSNTIDPRRLDQGPERTGTSRRDMRLLVRVAAAAPPPGGLTADERIPGRRPVPDTGRHRMRTSPSIGASSMPLPRAVVQSRRGCAPPLSCTRRRLRRSRATAQTQHQDRYVVVGAGKTSGPSAL